MVSSGGKRLMAHILDSIAHVVLFSVGLFIAGISYPTSIEDASNQYIAACILILILSIAIIQSLFWMKGTSMGKSMLGMKVMNKDTEEHIGFFRMFFREVIGKYISGLVCGLGYIWILIDSENQGWHDKIFNTIVVDK